MSIIICCYNSSTRIPQTLEHIWALTIPDHIKCELIIVNNASTDDTVETIERFRDANPISRFDTVIVDESKPGLNIARETGLAHSTGEFIIFCDDDNWLDSNYLKIVTEFFDRYEDAVIVGGKNHAECEVEPPDWFHERGSDYAVGEFGESTQDFTDNRGFVWGAGMAIRRLLFDDLAKIGHSLLSSDRRGESLSSGGDSELCFAARLLGYRVYYHPELQLRHFITKERLKFSYLKKLNYSFGQATTVLDCYHKKYHESAVAVPPSAWIKEVKHLMRKLVYLKRSFPQYFFGSEEDFGVVRVSSIFGRLSGLLRLRGKYASNINHCIHLFSKQKHD